jgi:hypothetical protein
LGGFLVGRDALTDAIARVVVSPNGDPKTEIWHNIKPDGTTKFIIPKEDGTWEILEFTMTREIVKESEDNKERFCNSCSGPYDGWLKDQYGGHLGSCPNRWGH